MTRPVAVSTGFVALDIVCDGPGSWCTAGGSAGNVSVILAELGWDVFPVARLDDSLASRMLLDDLAREGMHLEFMQLLPTTPAPLVVQTMRRDDDGEPVHGFAFRCPRCSNYLPGYAEVVMDAARAATEGLPRARAFYFDRPKPGNLILARSARDQGAVVVFEPNKAEDGKNFEEAVALADIVRYSQDKISELITTTRPLLEVQTLGADGLRFRGRHPSLSDSGWTHLDAVAPDRLVDTAGSGDWASAVLIDQVARHGRVGLERLDRDEIEQALVLAQRAAARNCAHLSARGGMYPDGLPDGAEKDARLAELCPTCRQIRETAEARRQGPRVSRRFHTISRPGFVGRRARKAGQDLDRKYGKDGWRIAYLYRGDVITRERALDLYAAAYHVHLRDNPDVLEWLLSTACDVYDIAPSDVESGTDFTIQKSRAVHLQDIAVRIAVRRLGREFAGEELLQIRGKRSRGARLGPGVVPFHDPDAIEQPELDGWWGPQSVEAFWQSNKVLQVRRERTLVFGGSFNPPHLGHLEVARFARDQLGFTRVIFVPNGDNYRKKGLAPARDRLDMVEAAVAGKRGFEVDDSEVHSDEKLRVVQTTNEIRERFPDDDLVVYRGVDALKKTHRDFFTIPRLHVLVLDRSGSSASFDAVVSREPQLDANRDLIDYRQGEFDHAASSSKVRRKVAAGKPIADLVPTAVEKIIEERGLYADRRSTSRDVAVGARARGTEPVQYIVVRRDLNMSRGKMAAQVAHASLGSVLPHVVGRDNTQVSNYEGFAEFGQDIDAWLDHAAAKVVLAADSRKALERVARRLDAASIPYELVHDSCRTELHPETADGTTATCLGICPIRRDRVPSFLKGIPLWRD